MTAPPANPEPVRDDGAEPVAPEPEPAAVPVRRRRGLGEIAIEALMVVFAVLAALGVEEWRETRQLRAFADRARAAVDLEIGENLAEFRRAEPGLIAKRDEMEAALGALARMQRGEPLESGLELTFEWDLPEISTASWRVAQSSQAAPYFDYDWVIARAREYERLERYLVVLTRTTEDLIELQGSAAIRDIEQVGAGVRRLYGRLAVLVQLHEGLRADMEAYLDRRNS